ncbi:MAG TPA: PPK2 family polyphosphate kinase [Acidimicrobiales bacterium]|nr:PPK2 family polyphosphate kinase [Acidimicrobiales bacterium]
MLQQLRVRPGDPANLLLRDPAATPDAPGGKEATEAALESQLLEIDELQERLYAERRRSLLLVLQGMDTSGKDGTIRHVIKGLNPAGTRVAAFKEPSAEELAHDFLWRVHQQVPRSGEVAVFNRSHYEDVLAVRVKRLAPEAVWRMRYEHINAFERLLGHNGTRVVKCFLHVSSGEQALRLRERSDDPTKRWKLSAEDVADHGRYEEYLAAYAEMLERTSTDQSPWWVVPADHKWYRNWAVSEILLLTLRDMGPRYPELPPLPEAAAL